MATGACGINCGVCRLNKEGKCSSCGPGTSEEASRKIAAQVRLLGEPCPVLECAWQRRKAHCLRDCDEFPCDRFQSGPYPFSSSFLLMQERRREMEVDNWRKRTKPLEVDESHWLALERSDPMEVATRSRCLFEGPRGFLLEFLKEGYWIQPFERKVIPDRSGAPFEPYLPLVLVIFLLRSKDIPLAGDMVSERELPGGELFFRHLHRLPTEAISERFGSSPQRFLEIAVSLGGELGGYSPASVKLTPLPRIPLWVHLWPSDEEFEARCNFTFDSTIAEQLPLDVIWALCHVVVQRILYLEGNSKAS